MSTIIDRRRFQADPFQALRSLQEDLVELVLEIMTEEDVPIGEALRMARALQPTLLGYSQAWDGLRVVTL